MEDMIMRVHTGFEAQGIAGGRTIRAFGQSEGEAWRELARAKELAESLDQKARSQNAHR
jgi:hypothetical protein